MRIPNGTHTARRSRGASSKAWRRPERKGPDLGVARASSEATEEGKVVCWVREEETVAWAAKDWVAAGAKVA